MKEKSQYDRVIETLATAEVGFVMKNDQNGRTVRVTDSDKYMYFCADTAAGIFYATSSEDEAYRWLEGTLFDGLNCGNLLAVGKLSGRRNF